MLKMRSIICLIVMLPGMFAYAFAQDNYPVGTLKGTMIDRQTKEPLAGANVILIDTRLGAATDLKGNFTIQNIPVGAYSIQFSYIGYETITKTDIIIKSNRTTFIESDLGQSTMQTETIEVNAGYFVKMEEQPVSLTNFSREEIRRAPGSAGDVSRILMSLPSIAKVNDQSNSLVVRGGSPVENSFYIDNIEIPNINHFPTQGSSGGPIGILNVEFIKDVDFYAGGFSPMYGDKLSSIMNIRFREGNRERFNGQLDLNWAGFGGVFEGPVFDQQGSWLFSARRSYLEWVIKMFDVGTSVAPSYGDIQGKLVYDLSDQHRITVLGILADSHSSSTKQVADENAMIAYGDQDIYEFAAGLNWRALWSKLGYSNTSLSFTSASYKENFSETSTQMPLLKNNSLEQTITLRNTNHLHLNDFHSVQVGFEIKQITSDYDNFYAETLDPAGNIVPALKLTDKISTEKYGLFLNYIINPVEKLRLNLGIRGDLFSYNNKSVMAPRFSAAYKLNDRTTISGSAGLFYQNLPLLLLAQRQNNRQLKTMQATHYILGVNHLISENTRLTVEVYKKDYKNFPLDSAQPGFFIIDELYYNHGFFTYHENLNDNGKAFTQGVELTIQKRLAKDFYGLLSASYFQSRYSDSNGLWKNRVYDNRVVLSVEGGYKPNNEWEFSMRWIYAGGPPYTPYDQKASREINRGILDDTQINNERYPDYHSLNVRFDKRFHFTYSNLIVYLSIWNVYNQKNVASYYWNDSENKQDVIYQWGLLPIFGLEYEF